MDEFGRRREDWVTNETPLLLGVVTFELRLMNLNRSWERILGYPRVMLAGKPLTRLIDQGEHALALTLLNTRPARADALEYAPGRGGKQTDRILAAMLRRNVPVLRVGAAPGARGRGGVHRGTGHHRAQENGNHGQPAKVPAVEEVRAVGLKRRASRAGLRERVRAPAPQEIPERFRGVAHLP